MKLTLTIFFTCYIIGTLNAQDLKMENRIVLEYDLARSSGEKSLENLKQKRTIALVKQDGQFVVGEFFGDEFVASKLMVKTFNEEALVITDNLETPTITLKFNTDDLESKKSKGLMLLGSGINQMEVDIVFESLVYCINHSRFTSPSGPHGCEPTERGKDKCREKHLCKF